MDLPKTPRRSPTARYRLRVERQAPQKGEGAARGFDHERECESQMAMGSLEHERLLTPAEVAAMFRVDPKTVTRWAQAGKLTAIRTLGGHRRYRESEVSRLLEAG